MASITKETVVRDGKSVTRYRAFIRRAGFKSKSKVFDTLACARVWVRDAEATSEMEKAEAAGIYTFARVVETFVSTPPRKGFKFWAQSHLDWWLTKFGPRDIKSITRADINLAVADLQAKKVLRRMIDGNVKGTDTTVSAGTVNRYLASLSSVLNFALDTGLIERHPIKGGQVKKLTESQGRRRILTPAEETRLIEEARKCQWAPMALFINLALTTGARKSELLRLRWSDIDLDRRIAVLPKTKNSEPRSLPLVISVRDALIEAKKVRPLSSDLVFFDPKRPEKAKSIDTIWRFVRQRAGLEADRDDRMDYVVLHSTRHTAATKLIRGGSNLIQAAAVTGHKTVGMLKKYTHLDGADVVALADQHLERK